MATTTLYSRGWFGSRRVLIEKNCLGYYEHQFGSDRVRRMLFDRLESVVVWRRFPWDRAAIFTIVLGLPALVLTVAGVYMNEPGLWGFGAVVLCLWALVFGRFVWYGRSTILVHRDGKSKRIHVIVSPRKLTRFLETLDQAVVLYQSTHRKNLPDHEIAFSAATDQTIEFSEPQP